MAAAIAAAVIYGAAYPATAVAIRSFSPLAVAGLSCTLALVIVVGLAITGVLPAPAVGSMTRPVDTDRAAEILRRPWASGLQREESSPRFA